MGQGLLLIPLVRVSLINVGSWFFIKIWILAFLGKYSNILLGLKVCLLRFATYFNIFVGSQSVSIEVRIIWYQSTGSKISFLSLLSFVSCYHPILFLSCYLFFVLILWSALGQNHALSSKKKKKDFRKEIENRKKKIVRSFNSLKSKYYFPLSSSFDLVFLSYFLAIGISLNNTSWISWSSLLV